MNKLNEMAKPERLKAYLKHKENVDKDIFDCFTRGDMTVEIYQKLLESGEKGYIEFLRLLNTDSNKGQIELDLDFNQK